jgi:hypothetical protein
MARVRGEVRKRHPECAANLRLEMVDLAGEAVGRQPLGHGFGIEEGAKNLFRLGGEDTMQTNGIALGHDAIFSMTERSISRDLPGLAQSLPQGRPASQRADTETKKFRRHGRAGSVQVIVERRG